MVGISVIRFRAFESTSSKDFLVELWRCLVTVPVEGMGKGVVSKSHEDEITENLGLAIRGLCVRGFRYGK